MPDAVDMATEIEAENLARSLAAARAEIPAGVPGECDRCFEEMPRLVGGLCAPCRDGRRRIAPVVHAAEPVIHAAEPVPGATPRVLMGPLPADPEPKAALVAKLRDAFAGARADPAEVQEKDDMVVAKAEARQVAFTARGETLRAIEARAKQDESGMGPAALALLEQGLAQPSPALPAEAEPQTPRQRMAALLGAAEKMMTDLIEDAEDAGDTTALEGQRDVAIERAEAAEAKLAQLRGLLS